MILDTLFKKKSEADASKAKAKNDIMFLEKRRDEIIAKAEKVANAGDEDEYIRLTDEATQLDRRIYVKGKIANIETTIPEEEVLRAWNEYAAAYEKTFQADYADYVKAAKKLFEQYTKMIKNQNEALKVRRKCGELMGIITPGHSQNDDSTLYGLHINGIPQLISNKMNSYCNYYGHSYPDAAIPMFWALGCMSEEDSLKYSLVVTNTATDLS